MDTHRLVIETEPALEDVRFLHDRLYEYNVEQTGVDDGEWLGIFLRDAHGVIQAGIHGWTWCGTAYISTLWVHRDLRGQGVGTSLLRAAEQEARARGSRHMVLNTYSFQAPEFYQKLGYEVFAVLEDHPLHHRHYSLRKRLV